MVLQYSGSNSLHIVTEEYEDLSDCQELRIFMLTDVQRAFGRPETQEEGDIL